MPSVPGKGSGGRRNEAAALNGKKVGRPAKRVWIALDLESAALAQRLMLHDWPGVASVEDLIPYALRKLAETIE